MRENEPALLVLSTYDGKLFLRKVKFYLRNVKYCFHSRSGSDPHLHGLARTTLWRRTVERVPLWGVAARFLWCGAHCIAAATAGIAALRVPVWGTVPGREYVLVRSLLEFEQALDAHDPPDGDDGLLGSLKKFPTLSSSSASQAREEEGFLFSHLPQTVASVTIGHIFCLFMLLFPSQDGFNVVHFVGGPNRPFQTEMG